MVHGDCGAAIGFVRLALVSCPQPNGFLELALLSALCCIAVRARAGLRNAKAKGNDLHGPRDILFDRYCVAPGMQIMFFVELARSEAE